MFSGISVQRHCLQAISDISKPIKRVWLCCSGTYNYLQASSGRYNKVALMFRDLSQQVCNTTNIRTFSDFPGSTGAPFNDLPQSGIGNIGPRQLKAPFWATLPRLLYSLLYNHRRDGIYFTVLPRTEGRV